MPKGAVADLATRFGLTEDQQAQLGDIKTYGQWADFIQSVMPDQDAKVESIVEMMGDLFEARINANNAPSARRAVGRVFEYMGLNGLADKMYNNPVCKHERCDCRGRKPRLLLARVNTNHI